MTDKIKIDPQKVSLDIGGTNTRWWFVRLPKGATADDLRDPAIWSLVQQRRDKALMKHDRLYLVGHAEDFAVEARVTDCNSTAAVLALMKIIAFPERMTPPFSDGTYRVAWSGSGYVVERISDGAQMGGEHGSEALAIQHIRRLYPVHVE